MKENVDYSLLVRAERLRYQSDFSAAHWLNLIISHYSEGLRPKIAKVYEEIILIALHLGIKEAVKVAQEYPKFLGLPNYVKLKGGKEWNKTKDMILSDFDKHLRNRFSLPER